MTSELKNESTLSSALKLAGKGLAALGLVAQSPFVLFSCSHSSVALRPMLWALLMLDDG